MRLVVASRSREGCTMADTAIDMIRGFEEDLPLSPREEGYGNQTLPNTSVPFVPPKPNEFLTATSICILRAALAQ